MAALVGYEGHYEVNEQGEIYSLKKKYFGTKMKYRLDKDGYCIVNLCLNGIKITEKVHRLVAKTFHPNPLNLPEVNHKDANKQNNAKSNLEWCNNQHNISRSFALGLRGSLVGKTHKPNKKVFQLSSDGTVIKEFESLTQAERETSIGLVNISQVLHGRQKTAGGFRWQFA